MYKIAGGEEINEMKKINNKYAKLTLNRKVQLIILLFSIPSLVILSAISLIVIYQSQISKITEESVEEIQESFDYLNYKKQTIELMAKTVWSDMTFIEFHHLYL